MAATGQPGSAALASPEPYRRLTFWLLWLCTAAITHGSLYPWAFRAPTRSLQHEWHRLWFPDSWWTTRGDIIGNVLLFVPLGMLAWLASSAWRCPAWVRVLRVLGLAMLLAVGLQVLQIWVPQRDAAFSDAVWNGLGLLLGMASARVVQQPITWLAQRLRSPLLLAYAMALYWLMLLWWPLLPLLKREVYVSAWARLRDISGWQPLPTALAALALFVVLQLLRGQRHRAALAWGLVGVAHLGSFVFVHKAGAVDSVASNTVGWGLGLAAGLLVWQLRPRLAHTLLLTVAASGWLLSVLQPLQWNLEPSATHWLPLAAALSEPRVANSAALLWQGFWIMALTLAAQRLGLRLRHAAVALTLGVMAVEWLQRWMPGQQADITPVLLPVACAWILSRLLQRTARYTPLTAGTCSPL